MLTLASLAAEPKHGSALIRDIARFAGVTLGPGSLYECLVKLEHDGLIERLPEQECRRLYQITGAGRAALAERSRKERITRLGLERLAPDLA